MARTARSTQKLDDSGLAPSYTAVDNTNGEYIANDGQTFLHVKNGGGGSINVTVTTPGTIDGLAIADRVIAVPASGERFIGPFPPNIYNQSDGSVYVDYSGGTSVTAAALRY